MKYGKLAKSVTLESFNNAIKPTTTFFYYGCNFRCGFCHNHIMLGDIKEDELMTEAELDKILRHAKHTWKKMISITGGEPTLDPKLPDFLRYIKDWGFEVKLDSNGSRPEILKQLIDEGLVDYIAMDIKGTLEQYEAITKYKQLDKLKESIKLIQTLPNYEFRTTVLPNHHTLEDIKKIGEWLKGSKRYVLQQFRPDLSGGCLDESYCKLVKMPKDTLEEYANAIKDCFDEVKVR